MNSSQALNFVDIVIETAISYRKQYGEVPLSFLFIFPDGKIAPVQVPNVQDKDVMVTMIRNRAQKEGAKYVVNVGEAWMSGKPGAPPSQQADRIEVILINIDGPDLRRMTLIEIKPDGTIGEPVHHESATGRMTNLSGSDTVDYN